MDSEEYIILRKLQNGDSGALDILYLRYASKVRDFALRLLKDQTDAEDITHDIFLRIWDHRRNLEDVYSFKGYLFRMTRNAIFNVMKRRQMQYKYLKTTESRIEERAKVEPSDAVSTDELLEMIDLAVRNMPEQRRKVFYMSRHENMSYDEIAKTLNISPRTVQYHISNALAELRKLLSSLMFFV